jgi:hypothetical protein
MTLEQKAAQMLQPAVYMATPKDMGKYCYGSSDASYKAYSKKHK